MGSCSGCQQEQEVPEGEPGKAKCKQAIGELDNTLRTIKSLKHTNFKGTGCTIGSLSSSWAFIFYDDNWNDSGVSCQSTGSWGIESALVRPPDLRDKQLILKLKYASRN